MPCSVRFRSRDGEIWHGWRRINNGNVGRLSEALIFQIILSDIQHCQNNNSLSSPLSQFFYVLFFFWILVSFICVSRPEECARPFPLHPCLVSPDSELAFLRCVARILLLCLLPQKDAKSHTLRCCLTEVITTKGTWSTWRIFRLCVSVHA